MPCSGVRNEPVLRMAEQGRSREPYTVEPSPCRHANKTGMIVINKKSWPVQMEAVRSYSDYLEGSLDLKHNCQVGTHTHGGVVIDRQVTQSILEVSVRMEWARVNEVSGMITTTSGLIAHSQSLIGA